jgi:hypothetical protein
VGVLDGVDAFGGDGVVDFYGAVDGRGRECVAVWRIPHLGYWSLVVIGWI